MGFHHAAEEPRGGDYGPCKDVCGRPCGQDQGSVRCHTQRGELEWSMVRPDAQGRRRRHLRGLQGAGRGGEGGPEDPGGHGGSSIYGWAYRPGREGAGRCQLPTYQEHGLGQHRGVGQLRGEDPGHQRVHPCTAQRWAGHDPKVIQEAVQAHLDAINDVDGSLVTSLKGHEEVTVAVAKLIASAPPAVIKSVFDTVPQVQSLNGDWFASMPLADAVKSYQAFLETAAAVKR